MTILGIETSCDETSAAVIDEREESLKLLSQSTATSLALHATTGGIIPESAAREQLKYILPVIQKALSEAFPNWSETDTPPIDAIAVTYGPGLIGSLLVGVETAKTLSLLWDKPLIPVNHLYGHIFANFIDQSDTIILRPSKARGEVYNSSRLRSNNNSVAFPALALVASGGHTDLVFMKSHQALQVIGGTRDDAAGEAFDKIGRLLGLSYPAGPIIAKLAEKGDPKAFALPRPMLGSKDFDFSFSGLKTAVLNLVKNDSHLKTVIASDPPAGPDLIGAGGKRGDLKKEIASSQVYTERIRSAPRNDDTLSDLCASVQQAIVDVLVKKTIAAAKEYNVKSILLGGGVAANDLLRKEMKHFALSHLPYAKLFAPAKSLCTDNGAMIAAAAYFSAKGGSAAGGRNIVGVPFEKITADPELYY